MQAYYKDTSFIVAAVLCMVIIAIRRQLVQKQRTTKRICKNHNSAFAVTTVFVRCASSITVPKCGRGPL